MAPDQKSEDALIVVAGPTAAGKSALALAIAERLQGAVINADSMQVYRALRILTARPGPADIARAPHHLYGHVDESELYSAARWRHEALAAMEQARNAGRLPILVGGTGLYLRILLSGIAPVPEIPERIRDAARNLFAADPEGFHARLRSLDPAMADRLMPGDRQRLIRAYEVVRATGKSLAAWQAMAPEPGWAGAALRILVQPPRAALYAACDRRFDRMLDHGALAEVEALTARYLDPDLPAMKALGVPALRAYLANQLSREAAIAEAKRQTRRYAKRQTTWFRHQFAADMVVTGPDAFDTAVARAERFVLTRHRSRTRPADAASQS